MPRRPLVTAIAVLSLTVGLAACGGSDDAASDPAPTTATTATSTTAGPAATTATPSAGCGSSATRSVVLEKQYLDDSDRWWLLTTPLDHDGETPLPLVLDFHGITEGADIHSRMSNLSPFAEDNGFVLAIPEATGPLKSWKVDQDREANPDLVFTDAMLDQLEATLCIDTSRVYATGLSNGAFFTSTLACTMTDRIAAVAPVAGVQRSEGCDPARPMPLLTFHGTADPILLFNGGVSSSLGDLLSGDPGAKPGEIAPPPADLNGPGYPAAAQAWAEANGCEPEPSEEAVTDTVTNRIWDCPEGAEVEFLILDGGGHSWPGSEFSAKLPDIMGATDLSIDANEIIWDFFERYTLPAT